MFLWYCSQFEMPTYGDDYEYPVWAQYSGISLAVSSMVCVPVYFVYKLCISPGNTLIEVNNTAPSKIPDLYIYFLPCFNLNSLDVIIEIQVVN